MTTEFDEPRSPREGRRSTIRPQPPKGVGFENLALHALARIAEQHHHRDQPVPTTEVVATADVTALAQALADADSPDAEARVAELLDGGTSVQTLCAEHLAPAARLLGAWWESDEMPFAVVTLATARIQTILRTLPRDRTPRSIKTGKGALFAAVPGEDHTLGVLMAADHFRRLGWDIGLLIGMDHVEARARILEDDRPVLGLSCTSVQAVANLRRLVEDLRHRKPDLAIVVSGGVAGNAEMLRTLPDFDGIVTRLDGAERVLSAAHGGARSQMRMG